MITSEMILWYIPIYQKMGKIRRWKNGKMRPFQNSGKLVFIIVCTGGLRNIHHGMRFDFQLEGM